MARDLSKILIIDLEATCWDSEHPPEGQRNEIIEIGCVLFDLKKFEILKESSILVKPQFSTISEFCTKLTTIDQYLLNKEGMNFPEAIEMLKKEFKPRDITWASYGDYDRVQMDKNCELYSVKNPLGRTHKNIKNDFAIKYGLNREVGMEQALKFLEIPLVGTHHRGLADAKNITEIFKRIWTK